MHVGKSMPRRVHVSDDEDDSSAPPPRRQRLADEDIDLSIDDSGGSSDESADDDRGVFKWEDRALCHCQLARPESPLQLFVHRQTLTPRGVKNYLDHELADGDVRCCNFAVSGGPSVCCSRDIHERVTNDKTGVFEGLSATVRRGIVHIHRLRQIGEPSYELFLPEIMHCLLNCKIKHAVRCSKRNQQDKVWTHCIDTKYISPYKSRTFTYMRFKNFVEGGKTSRNYKLCICNQEHSQSRAVHIADNVVIWVGADCHQRFFSHGEDSIEEDIEVDNFDTAMREFDTRFEEERALM